ncbi:MAG: nickel-responsive transcriptional regulator NikR [Candidatus Saganbacteria bacterium]|nr:nickel-responsive transcriptional regulator NikR [Candidatus Saganbacteria bacterium]
MTNTERFGVSIPKDLIEKFDRIIAKKGYPSRSEAIRDLIRDNIVEQSIEEDKEVVGVISIVFDHHTRELADKLNDIEHDHHKQIVASTHIHLDHHNCLEVIVVKGTAKKVQELGEKLISTRGVKHGKVVLTSTGKEIV